MIKMLPDGTLLVHQRCEDIEKEIVWDLIIEIKKNDPRYQEYLRLYEHDLEIIKKQKDILEKK